MISIKLRKREIPLHLMLLPAIILVFIFSYVPMAGIIIAFQNFVPAKGLFGIQEWVGLKNFQYVLELPNFFQVFWNTIYIAFWKIVTELSIPIAVAILLNEVVPNALKRGIQTLIYLPHFLSWIILGGILIDILSPTDGVINMLLQGFGLEPVFFLGNNQWFRFTVIATNIWKEFGFGTVVYLASITSIDQQLYESALADGANWWQRMRSITLPGMSSIIVLMMVLSLGNILNAGFDQVFNMYTPLVYQSGDIIDTLVYRVAFLDAKYSIATSVGLFKSVISFIMISISYFLADRLANYRVF